MVRKESRGFLTPPAWRRRRRREEKRRRRGSEHLNRRRSLHCAVSGAWSAVTERLRWFKQTSQRRKHRFCSRPSVGSSGAKERRTRGPLEAIVSVTEEDVLWTHHWLRVDRTETDREDARTFTCSPERRSRSHARLRLQVPGEAEEALPVSALQQGHAGAGAGLHLWTPLLWHLSARIPQVRRRSCLCVFVCVRARALTASSVGDTGGGFGWG